MRRLLLAVVMFGTAAGAQAADMPDFLRGTLPASTPTRNWDGWYAGGQASESWGNANFTQTATPVINSVFANTTLETATSQFTLLGSSNAQSPGFGAFVGRNFQYDDIVLGVEANYKYLSNLAASSSGRLGPVQITEPGLVLAPGDTAADSVSLSGHASVQLKDELTFRGRAGWAIGDFLPYAFGGVAVGQMAVSRTVSSNVDRTIFHSTGTPIPPPTLVPLTQFNLTASDASSNVYTVGWTAGLGAEYMLWGSVFVRGEWEYIKFVQVDGTAVSQNSVTAAIGYKF